MNNHQTPKVVRQLQWVLGLLLLTFASLAGCMDSNPSTANLCRPVFYVGCDNNQDAHAVLEKYGFQQLTNTTFHLGQLEVQGGRIAFGEGGFGSNVSWDRIVSPGGNELWSQAHVRGEGSAVSAGFRFDGHRILEKRHNRIGNDEFGLAYGRVWDFLNGTAKEVYPPTGNLSYALQFSGSWVLWVQSQNHTSLYDVYWAINVDTGQQVELWDTFHELREEGMEIESYGIADGTAYLSIHPWNRKEGSQLVAWNLETNETRVLLDANDTTFQYLYYNIGDRYIVTTAYPGGEQVLRAIERSTGEVTDIPVLSGTDPGYVRSGGDWIVYGESYYQPPGFDLVAVHIPTQERVTLYSDDYDTALLRWDTDGDLLAVVLELSDGRGWQYPGAQVYWRELPGSR